MSIGRDNWPPSGSSPEGNVLKARPINADPFIIHTTDADVQEFLSALPAPDFDVVADGKALWSTTAENAGEGTSFESDGSAYIVSAEAYKYVKAHRY